VKRSSLARQTPLQRRAPLRARGHRIPRGIRQEVLDRANGRCEARIPGVCTIRATDCHHVILRSQGGPDEAWNLVALCGPLDGREGCHRWLHAHPAEARRLGFIRSRTAA
jgi:hypothetical protein